MSEDSFEDWLEDGDGDKVEYMLEKGFEAIGPGGEFSVTEEEFDEVLEHGKDDQIRQIRQQAEEYIQQIPYRDSKPVRQKSYEFSESANLGRTVEVNAAGAVYAASLSVNQTLLQNNQRVTQSYIADITGISESAISHSYEEIFHNHIG